MKLEIFKGGYDRNLSYLIVDEKLKKGYVIDPFKNVEIYFDKAEEFGIEIVGVLNTHSHKDHVEGNSFFIEKNVKILNSIKDKIKIEGKTLRVLKTPGHCDDSVCFFLNFGKEKFLFTGDDLLPGRVGITRDFEHSKIFFKSLQKLKKLNEKFGDVKVYPGHHYNKKIPFLLEDEIKSNPYLKCSRAEEFEKVMDKWRLYTREHFAKRAGEKCV